MISIIINGYSIDTNKGSNFVEIKIELAYQWFQVELIKPLRTIQLPWTMNIVDVYSFVDITNYCYVRINLNDIIQRV